MSVPDTPTPAPRALRPSLMRIWREETESEQGVSSSDSEEELPLPAPSFSLASDDDVDAALRAPRKGKNVDPRERPRRRRGRRQALVQRLRFALRSHQLPSSIANRNPTRRYVSPTESVYALTNQIGGLGTDEIDQDEDALDEKDVTSTLLADVPEEGTSQFTPLPTSPAAGSDTEVDEPTSPLAAKAKARRAATRFARQARSSAKKRKTRNDDSDDGVEALRALESLAEKIGYRLVPMSPGRGEPMDADPEFPLPPPMRVVPYTEGYDGCDDRDQKSKDPISIVARSATPDIVEKIPPKTTSPATSRARQRYTTTVPLAKANEPVTPTQARRRRQQRQRDAQLIPRSTGPETSHLKRSSPTSLLPSRVHLRKPRVFARRPVVLFRPRRVSRFLSSWGITDELPPVVPGFVYAAATRDRAIFRQVRSSLLRRYRERLAFAQIPRPRARINSISDEEAIEFLLPSDDVEMFDSKMVDDELCAISPTSPSPAPGPSSRPHRPNKRAAAWGSAEVAARAEIRATQRTKELGEWTHGLRMHILARRAAREAAKQATAQRTRQAVAAALHAVEEQRAEAAELARLAAEAQIAYDAEMARRASAAAEQRARAQELAAQRRRRRAADSVAAHVAARPGTRLAAIHRRPAVPVPIATRNAPAGPSRPRERESTPERDVEIEIEIEVARAVPEPQTPVRRASPVLASPIQLADDVPVPASPPRYEYPFFPIVRAAPPVHLRAPIPRRVTAPAASPPHYVVNRYEIDDPPTPPPPYNAQTDCTTLVAAVFHEDAEAEEVDERDERELAHEINVAAYAAMRRDREHVRVQDLDDGVDEEMDVEIENALGLQYAEYEYEYAEYGAFADEDDNADGRPAGALGALRRWFGW